MFGRSVFVLLCRRCVCIVCYLSEVSGIDEVCCAAQKFVATEVVRYKHSFPAQVASYLRYPSSGSSSSLSRYVYGSCL
ncbi:hypothetical protein C8Q74DRAFT_1246374 [Fomes fomentarius]|nr:hypothetical protein C8Q74DRAFT_1246374 [Fomes fomentarius]